MALRIFTGIRDDRRRKELSVLCESADCEFVSVDFEMTKDADLLKQALWLLLTKSDVAVFDGLDSMVTSYALAWAELARMPILILSNKKVASVFEMTVILSDKKDWHQKVLAWMVMQKRHFGKDRGLYIAFEGLNSCGKGTQIRLLTEQLELEGVPFRQWREPGGTYVGEEIRTLVQRQVFDIPSVEAEVGLYMAQRGQLLPRMIRPWLDSGVEHVAVSDRTLYTSLAFQGMGRAQGVLQIALMNRYMVGNLMPDIVFYLRTTPEVLRARQRDGAGEDRFELEDEGFEYRCFEGYEELVRMDALTEKPVWIVLNAENSIEAIAEEIWNVAKHRIVRAALKR